MVAVVFFALEPFLDTWESLPLVSLALLLSCMLHLKILMGYGEVQQKLIFSFRALCFYTGLFKNKQIR